MTTSTLTKIDFLKAVFFTVLFAWISFFPQPIQDKYKIYTWIFLGIFLLAFILDKRYLKQLLGLEDWPLWIFLLSIFPGIINVTDKSTALKTYLYLSITLFLIFYIGKTLVKPDKNINLLSIVICVCSIVVSLIGFFEIIYGVNPIYKYFVDNPFYERYISGIVRPMSTQLNPAPLATYLLFTWPFGIYLSKQRGWIKRLLGYVTIILNIVCLIMTFSRGSFLGLIFMILCYLFFMKKYKDLFIAIAAFLIIFTVLNFLPYPFSRFSFSGIGIYGTGIFSDYRIIRMKMSLQMLKSHPFFGVGLNHFRILFNSFYPFKSELPYIGYEIKIPDNMYLTLLAEAGIVGLTGFFIFMATLIYRGLKQFREINEENKKRILLISICILIGILGNMTGYELFYWSTPYILFCLICGFIQGAIKNLSSQKYEN